MLKFLAKLFIKTPREYDDPATRRAYSQFVILPEEVVMYDDPATRRAYGVLCGA